MPIRVAQVMGRMVGGGVESTIMNHYLHIDRNRVQFDFLVDEDSTVVPEQEIRKLGGRVFIVPRYKDISQYLRACGKIFKKQKPDIVHANINAMSVFPLAAARCSGIPVRIAHSHSTSDPGEYAKTLVKNMLRPFSRINATHLVACSTDSARWLFGRNTVNSGRVRIIKNAIELDSFSYDDSIRAAARRRLGIGDGQVVIGQVGRFCFQKNQLFSLQVLSELLKEYPNVILLLVGDGELRTEIKACVRKMGLKGNVRLLGQRNDVNELYQAFDVLMFPSRYEGLPLTVIEAQASGLPILMSTKVTSEVEILPELIHSLPLSVGPRVWAEELAKVVSVDFGHRKCNMCPFIRSGYDIQRSASELCTWYEAIVKG